MAQEATACIPRSLKKSDTRDNNKLDDYKKYILDGAEAEAAPWQSL